MSLCNDNATRYAAMFSNFSIRINNYPLRTPNHQSFIKYINSKFRTKPIF